MGRDRNQSALFLRVCLAAPFVLLALLALLTMVAGCGPRSPRQWAGYDRLRDRAPRPEYKLGDVAISEADYARFLCLGEEFFRSETLGNERVVTDVIGLMRAPIEVPCDPPSYPGCRRETNVLPYFAKAVDALDGVEGNLLMGNGGFEGTGYTHDLVIRFPEGTTLYGLEVPREVHTGLDVEAGSAWPIGVVPVAAPVEDRGLPYLIDPATLDVGPAPTDDKFRAGITCALCHYSLDVDWDGKTDLRSAWSDRPTPGSRYRPEDGWAVGNQDLHVGWIFALAANPLLGTTVLGGPIGHYSPEASLRWTKWVRDNYQRATEATKREVVRAMITQPRGYADISTNSKIDTVQYPLLFTRGVWPYNYDGSLLNASDRNSSVWTTALDFTGLIGLAKDRAQSGQAVLYWEPANIYEALDAETYADMFVFDSPAVRHDPSKRRALKDDILGYSDGVPGMLRPDSVVVMEGPQGMVPPRVLAKAKAEGLFRKPEDYPGDGEYRDAVMALVGTRVRTPPHVIAEHKLYELKARYPDVNIEEFMNDAVSLMLDSLDAPRNPSPQLPAMRPLLEQGYRVFAQAGCVECHRGPYMTDNRIHREAVHRQGSTGLPYAPSTAGFRRPGHHRGQPIGTEPSRMISSRPLALFAAPDYDPKTGEAYRSGSPLWGLFSDRQAGYKTAALRYLWGSAPFLHDGGIGVGLKPQTAPPSDLRSLLSVDETQKVYGMGRVLAYREAHPETSYRADAALSLQALVLRSERAKVVAANREPSHPVPRGATATDVFGDPVPERVAMRDLGVRGTGHDFYVDDVPGGERVTALIAFLLSIDEEPMLPDASGGTEGAATSGSRSVPWACQRPKPVSAGAAQPAGPPPGERADQSVAAPKTKTKRAKQTGHAAPPRTEKPGTEDASEAAAAAGAQR